MKIAVYTSLAINYMAKARALSASLQRYAPHIDLFALICDTPEHETLKNSEGFKDIWFIDEYPHENVSQWIFKHSIMELCTAGKGWGLNRLLDEGYDYVFYLDPDCWVFADLGDIIEHLPKDKSVSVVPHTLTPADSEDEIEVVELSSLKHGVFNLGYLLVRNDENGRKFARWWAKRLHDYCTDDWSRGLFTDQRWIDLAVGYFDFIEIDRHPGIDVASWNVRHREISRVGDDNYTVDGLPMYLYHFSGVGPNSVHRWVRERLFPDDVVAADLELKYEKEIDRFGQQELALVKPKYSFFADGVPIPKTMRSEYWSSQRLRENFPAPYEMSAAKGLRDAINRSIHLNHQSPPPRSVIPLKTGEVSSPKAIDYVARKLFVSEVFCSQIGRDLPPKTAWKEYCNLGWNVDVDPNPVFDTKFYIWQLGANASAAHYKTPLHHFVSEGGSGGLQPSIAYSENFYLNKYRDIAREVVKGRYYSGYEHFVRRGLQEQRIGSAYFSESHYLEAHPDVSEAVVAGRYISGAQHYWRHGVFEGRSRGF